MRMVERWTHRSDAWTRDDDDQLQQVVLRHIREGSTQLAAFVEAASALGRTPAACGYRWNGVLRKDYETSIREAKVVRKQRMQHRAPQRQTLNGWNERPYVPAAVSEPESDVDISGPLGSVIQTIRQVEVDFADLCAEKDRLEVMVGRQQAIIDQLQEELDRLQQLPPLTSSERLTEDSKTLLEIMERARKMLGGSDQLVMPNARFRMDRNGNLERVSE